MKIIEDIKNLAKEVKAENITIPHIKIEQKALDRIPSYLNSNKYKNIVLVVDENTRKAAGDHLENILLDQSNLQVSLVEIPQNKHGQVIADEPTLIQLLVEIPIGTNVILAVGSGTIHDMVRFVGFKMAIPFISVPTAASVDGFTSKGAPLIFHGVKQTIQTASPVAVFADIDILKEAPQEMTAAGFGDIIGKYTSLLDWRISDLVGNEPYNQLAADLTWRSLEACVNNVEEIAGKDDKGIKVLMQALIKSGLVMLILDSSRPASGSEHHLSHYWEMDLLNKDTKQLLHGAKVGVATTIIIELYKQMTSDLNIESISSDSSYTSIFAKKWNQIKIWMENLPASEHVQKLLGMVGGPMTLQDLKVNHTLVTQSLNEAFQLRDRCTGLFLLNQFKKETINYPIKKLSI